MIKDDLKSKIMNSRLFHLISVGCKIVNCTQVASCREDEEEAEHYESKCSKRGKNPPKIKILRLSSNNDFLPLSLCLMMEQIYFFMRNLNFIAKFGSKVGSFLSFCCFKQIWLNKIFHRALKTAFLFILGQIGARNETCFW